MLKCTLKYCNKKGVSFFAQKQSFWTCFCALFITFFIILPLCNLLCNFDFFAPFISLFLTSLIVFINKLQSRLVEIEQERQEFERQCKLRLDMFGKLKNIKSGLDIVHEMVDVLVDKILVYHDKHIEITFSFRDEFSKPMEFPQNFETEMEACVNG